MKYQKDYYQILGVGHDATPEKIKSAYRRLVVLNHPDRNLSPQATARMQEINEAYDVLGDQNKRTKYDFEHLNFTTASQPKDSAYADTANLQEFTAEENPLPVFHMVYFFLVLAGVAIMTTLAGFMKLQVSPLVVIFLVPVGMLSISGAIFFWKSSRSSKTENQCPKCGKVWAAEKLSEKLVGIFQKVNRLSRNSRRASFNTRAKYQIHYKCKYCSYEWLFIKTGNV